MVNTSLAPIELDGGANSQERGLFYNNVVVSNTTGAVVSVEDRGNVDIEHNTIVALRGRCIHVQGKPGLPTEINNNILVGRSAAPILYLEDTRPFTYFLDGNLYWNRFSSDIVQDGSRRLTLAQWQGAFGHDTHGMFISPKFNPGLYTLQVGSPAAEKAWMTKAYVTDDLAGAPRATKPTIGAYEGKPGPPPTTFTSFGAGCPGLGGKTPTIGYTGDLRLGSSNFTVTVNNARGGVLVRGFLAIGASNTSWNGVSLPLPLGSGCSLLVSPDLVWSQTISGAAGAGNGQAQVRLPIANDPALKGVKVHFQWGVVDAAAAAIGVAFSDGAVLRI